MCTAPSAQPLPPTFPRGKPAGQPQRLCCTTHPLPNSLHTGLVLVWDSEWAQPGHAAALCTNQDEAHPPVGVAPHVMSLGQGFQWWV